MSTLIRVYWARPKSNARSHVDGADALKIISQFPDKDLQAMSGGKWHNTRNTKKLHYGQDKFIVPGCEISAVCEDQVSLENLWKTSDDKDDKTKKPDKKADDPEAQ